MNRIQQIIDNHGVKSIEDYDDLPERKKHLLVTELRHHLHTICDYDTDWDIMANKAEEVVKRQLLQSSLQYSFFLEDLYMEGYRSFIKDHIYVPYQGEEEENILSNKADDLYNSQDEWYNFR